MADDHTITTPNLHEDADHCTLSHRNEILRGPPCTESLDQGQAHQAWPRRMISCQPPTEATEGCVPVTRNIFFTFINVLIMLTTASRAGSALLSTLLEGNWNTQPALHTLQSLGIKLPGNSLVSEKFTLRTTSAHAMLTPVTAWQDARETRANSKGTFARLLTALQSLWCHLPAVKQRSEETQDSNHIRLYLVTSSVIYHVDKLFQKSFPASWLHTPAFEIKKFELGLCSYDAEPTVQR